MQFFYLAFIVYFINENDVDRNKILTLSDLLCCCGVDCIIDQYHSNDNILSWPQWMSDQIERCISEEGYILLECSQIMFSVLKNSDNSPIRMTYGYIDCQTFKYFLRNKAKNILPICIDNVSSDFIPYNLSERIPYYFPFSKLPQKFISESNKDLPNYTQEEIKQLLAHPDFASLKSLVATLTGQQEICQPNVYRIGKQLYSVIYF